MYALVFPEEYYARPKLILGKQWISPSFFSISVDEGTRINSLVDEATIQRYAEIMKKDLWDWSADPKTPILLYFDRIEDKLWCGDGHARIKAARIASVDKIYVEIQIGNFAEAKLHYCLTKLRYGDSKRLDKRYLLAELFNTLYTLSLKDIRRFWSDREIARQTGVDHKTIGAIRRHILNGREVNCSASKRRLTEEQHCARRNARRIIKSVEEMPDEVAFSKALALMDSDKVNKLIDFVGYFTQTNYYIRS